MNYAHYIRELGRGREGTRDLSLDEARTLFHEFGHVLHNVLTEAKYSSISGTSVSRDFVEVPSQILENWAWHPVVLKQISKSYKTMPRLQ